MSDHHDEYFAGVRGLIETAERCREACLDDLIQAAHLSIEYGPEGPEDRPRIALLASAVAGWDDTVRGWKRELARLQAQPTMRVLR